MKISKSMKNIFKKTVLMFSVFMLVFSCVAIAAPRVSTLADNKSTPTPIVINDIFTSQGEGQGMFDSVTNTVKKGGASLRGLMMTIAIIALVIGLIILGISFATSHDPSKRRENKSRLALIIVGAIIIFGSIALLTLSQKIADTLASNVTESIDQSKSSISGPLVPGKDITRNV